jgi:hypothetical protein
MTALTTPAYLLGGGATLVEWGSYDQHDPQAFRRWSAAAAAAWALMYLLLGAGTAGLTMTATALRTHNQLIERVGPREDFRNDE